SYYRRFVKCFVQIARPLHKVCERSSKFLWSDETEHAFKSLKIALTTAPILAYPILGQQFILDTDASEHSVGAVLSQVQSDQERVIAYMSKTMNVHERAYCVTRKELLAVVVALRNFHTYLYGQNVLLRTDNAAVSWMRSLKRPTGQVARWLQELGTYDLTVVHRSGKKHENADALSRMPCKSCKRQQDNSADATNESDDEDCNSVPPEDQPKIDGGLTVESYAVTRQQQSDEFVQSPVLLDGWNQSDIRQSQIEDVNIGPILVLIEENKPRPDWTTIAKESSFFKTLWRNWDRHEVHGSILFRRWSQDEITDILQLIVPKNDA
ncbi:MAG: Ty3/Gypsy family RNase HI domain-containing protein, partial [Candidatus Thiodiazotropha taylori]|nr:Ty3/Gypsy family RNase HI domain-containing protein [Candidatus Thiodiazotropha taylori]MCW4310586.1 Ty3/Gypsy family RNase HI domain-containing protein [Candidatus Thiodiazotropha endolucinida]